MKILKPEEIELNSIVTILKWKSHQDRSWVGDILKVKAIDLPFVVLEFQQGWNKGNTHSFHENDVDFGMPSQEYIDAVMTKEEKENMKQAIQ